MSSISLFHSFFAHLLRCVHTPLDHSISPNLSYIICSVAVCLFFFIFYHSLFLSLSFFLLSFSFHVHSCTHLHVLCLSLVSLSLAVPLYLYSFLSTCLSFFSLFFSRFSYRKWVRVWALNQTFCEIVSYKATHTHRVGALNLLLLNTHTPSIKEWCCYVALLLWKMFPSTLHWMEIKPTIRGCSVTIQHNTPWVWSVRKNCTV